MSFALGQRWISDTESDLGLGTVVALEGRMVTLLFPATGDERLFAITEAPLTRVVFNQGDEITSHEGWKMTVESVDHNGELVSYSGKRTDTDEKVSLRETLLDHQIRFNKPQDRLFAGQLDRMEHYVTRYLCQSQRSDMTQNPLRALQGPRAGLIPHQLFIANEVGQRHEPRVLLADEVGLGKTIEAGHILHQQLLSGRAERVLILVPETLQHQWLVEMLRRFNLRFSLFDEERCIEAIADGDNPFETEQLVICAIDLLRRKKRFEQAMAADWDLLVVDEAHHLHWSPETPGKSYQVVEQLAKQTPGVLLLTATPDRLGHQSHFARLRLLDPDRFYDYQAFLNEEKAYESIASAADALLAQRPLNQQEKLSLRELLPEQEDLLAELDCVQPDDPSPRQKLLHSLLDRHGTSRVLFRNNRAGVSGFTQRILNPHPLELPKQYETALRVSKTLGGDDIARQMLNNLHPEKLYQEFDPAGSSWWQFDTRVNWMLQFLKANRSKKVLVITAQATTALQLEEALRTREGLLAGVFHEGMSIIERDKASAFFAQQEGGAQVLICSEIGSEGRNFQFAHNLILFDLPNHPDLLEQRIGRLDRIGQTKDVQIHVPYIENSAQHHLLNWYHQGLNAFEQTNPGGHLIHAEFGEQLQRLLAGQDEDLDKLIQQTSARAAEHKAVMEAGRDKLLELNSHGGTDADKLVEALLQADDNTDFISFMLKLWDVIGVHQDDKGENAVVLTPGDHMLYPSYPGLPDDGVSVTFDRDTALTRDDFQFITPAHPLVTGGIDLITSSEIGCAAVSLMKNKALPAGTLFLELIYLAEAAAPASVQLGRFLPPTPIRMLMDKSGQNLDEKIDFHQFNNQLVPINRHVGSKLIGASQAMLHPLIGEAEKLAEQRLNRLVTGAKEKLEAELGGEFVRLKALKQVNPNIRSSELEAIQHQIEQARHYLDRAQIQLDAIRLIVVSPE